MEAKIEVNADVFIMANLVEATKICLEKRAMLPALATSTILVEVARALPRCIGFRETAESLHIVVRHLATVMEYIRVPSYLDHAEEKTKKKVLESIEVLEKTTLDPQVFGETLLTVAGLISLATKLKERIARA